MAYDGSPDRPRRLSIMRIKPRTQYTQIPNALLRNANLSLQSRGLLAFVLSHPDDWEFDRAWLIKESGAGKDRLDAILAELEAKRHLRRTQQRLPNGRAGAWEYLFSQEPIEDEPTEPNSSIPRRGKANPKSAPHPENPEAVGPHPENPDAATLYMTKTVENEDCKNTKTEQTRSSAARMSTHAPGPEAKPKRASPRCKAKKAKAQERFMALSPEDAELAIAAAAQFAAECAAKGVEDRYTKMAEGWLNARRFEDYASKAQKPWWFGRDETQLRSLDDEFWRHLIKQRANGVWDACKICYPPGHPKCPIPQRLIDEMGLMALYGPGQEHKWRGVDDAETTLQNAGAL
jgi:hypothetical protein